MVPTKVQEKGAMEGAVYIGGFKAAINADFLKQENITHVVNVAGKGLGMMFGPKYRVKPFIFYLFKNFHNNYETC